MPARGVHDHHDHSASGVKGGGWQCSYSFSTAAACDDSNAIAAEKSRTRTEYRPGMARNLLRAVYAVGSPPPPAGAVSKLH